MRLQETTLPSLLFKLLPEMEKGEASSCIHMVKVSKLNAQSGLPVFKTHKAKVVCR